MNANIIKIGVPCGVEHFEHKGSRSSHHWQMNFNQMHMVGISGGKRIIDVIPDKTKRAQFLTLLNAVLVEKGIRPIVENGSVRFTPFNNKQLDELLVLSNTWETDKQFYPAFTGTMTAFEESGKRLANIIQFPSSVNYVFEVPRKMMGLKDVALAVNHMLDSRGRPLITYEGKGGNDVFVKVHDQSKINVVEDFPRYDGWYLAEPEFGIPTGKETDPSNPDARYLHNYHSCSDHDDSFVGFVTRHYIGISPENGTKIGERRTVTLGSDYASGVLGVWSAKVMAEPIRQ